MKKKIPYLMGSFSAILVVILILVLSNIFLSGKSSLPKSYQHNDPYVFGEYHDNHTNNPNWIRESPFIVYSQYKRYGIGPYLKTTPLDNTESAKVKEQIKPFHILVIGDSYTWGHGVDDQHARWGDFLATSLEAKFHRPIYVTTLAEPGSATITEAEWVTKQYLSQVKPDLVIIGLVFNDIMPTFLEKTVCKYQYYCGRNEITSTYIYNNCLTHHYGAVGSILGGLANNFPYLTQKLTALYCQPDKLSNVISFPNEPTTYLQPEKSPYFPFFKEGVKMLHDALSGYPTLVAPLPLSSLEPSDMDKLTPTFTKNGFKVLPMGISRNLVTTEQQDTKYYINPNDPHPNTFLVKQWSNDILSGILSNKILVAKINKSTSDFSLLKRPLVSSVMPAYIKVVKDDEQNSIINLLNPSSEDGFANPNTNSPKQFAPCIRYQNTYTQIMLNQDLPNGVIKVSMSLKAKSNYQLLSTGYDKTGKSITKILGIYKNSNLLSFKFEKTLSSLGFIVIDLNSDKCSINKVLKFSPYQLVLGYNK